MNNDYKEKKRRELLAQEICILIGGIFGGLYVALKRAGCVMEPLIWNIALRPTFPEGFNGETFKGTILIVFISVMTLAAYLYATYNYNLNTMRGKEHGDSSFATKSDMPRFNQLFFYSPKYCEEAGEKVKTYYDHDQLKKICKGTKHNKKATEHCFKNSQILAQDLYLSTDVKFINRNLNTVTIGGSGQGKSYSELFPNALNANGNYIFTDPSGEIYQKIGKYLRDVEGYELKIFNIDDMLLSMKYNPIAYVKTEADINILVDALIANIDAQKIKASSGNDFFEKGAKSLTGALVSLLKELYPEEAEKQTFSNIISLLFMARQEADKSGQVSSTLSKLFEELGKANPRSYAYKMWQSFEVGGPKVCNEIIISACADLSRYFSDDGIAYLTSKDELNLYDLASEKKCALFLVIPQHTNTYNFLSAMVYSQLFEIVTKEGKRYGAEHHLDNPALPRHLYFWLDEFANIGKMPNFVQLLSVVRKYNISINIIIQALSQLKTMYKEEWETIIGNLDTMIYLGGQEPSTIKMLSEKLGKETIKSFSYSNSRQSKGGSHSESQQVMAHSVATPDQIEKMPRACEMVFITGFKPFYARKYNLTKHPAYKYTGEADTANNLNVYEQFRDNEVDYGYLEAHSITKDELVNYDFSTLKINKKGLTNKYKEIKAKEEAAKKAAEEAKAEKDANKTEGEKTVEGIMNMADKKGYKKRSSSILDEQEKIRKQREIERSKENLNQDAMDIIKRFDLTNMDVYENFTPDYEFTTDDFNISDFNLSTEDVEIMDNGDVVDMTTGEVLGTDSEDIQKQAEEVADPEMFEQEEPVETPDESIFDEDEPEVGTDVGDILADASFDMDYEGPTEEELSEELPFALDDKEPEYMSEDESAEESDGESTSKKTEDEDEDDSDVHIDTTADDKQARFKANLDLLYGDLEH